MTSIAIIGIDPGIVDTGAVALHLTSNSVKWSTSFMRLPGEDPAAVRGFVSNHQADQTHVFVERYRERGNVFNTHDKMRKLERDIKAAVPEAKLIDNTGVKQVVKIALLELFGLYKFPTVTHHQDLRSAAYIAFYGALKDDALNRILTEITINELEGGPRG